MICQENNLESNQPIHISPGHKCQLVTFCDKLTAAIFICVSVRIYVDLHTTFILYFFAQKQNVDLVIWN